MATGREVDGSRLSSAILTLVGLPPAMNLALLRELVEADSEPVYGRLLARRKARRLQVPEHWLAEGRNYVSRVGNATDALRGLGVIESVPLERRARGNPSAFRLTETHRDMVASVVAAFEDGRGLPWMPDPAHGAAEHLCRRAARLNWDRDWPAALRSAEEGLRELVRAPRSDRADRARELVRGELLRQQADAQFHLGNSAGAVRSLGAALRAFRRLRGPLAAAQGRLGLARCHIRRGEVYCAAGRSAAGILEMERALRLLARPDAVPFAFLRERAVGAILLAQAHLDSGELEAARRRALEALAQLRLAEHEAGPLATHRTRANLAMNRARAQRALALAAQGLGHRTEGLQSARDAAQAAFEAYRYSGGRNPVILHWLAAALKTQLAALESVGAPDRTSRLRERADRAFRRSLELEADEGVRREYDLFRRRFLAPRPRRRASRGGARSARPGRSSVD